MLWIFTRAGEIRRYETRFDNDTSEYVLVIHDQGVPAQTERFTTVLAFQRRLDALEQQLEREQWQRTGAPVLLRDGWKI
jgi:hypothetical protein